MSLSILLYRLLENEDSISGAPPWHEPKLAFMDVRALSHPSIQYSLPYLEGVHQELDPSVVLALLDVTLFLEDGYEYAVSPC